MNAEELIQFSLMKTVNVEVPTVVFDTNRRIIFSNNSFAKSLGYSTQELFGMNHANLCFSTYTENEQYQIFWNTLLSGNQFQEQILRKAKDGSKVFFEAIYSPIKDDNGNVISIVKIAFDITQRSKVLQEVLHKIRDFTVQVNTLTTSGLDQINSTLTSVNNTQAFATKNKETSNNLLSQTHEANEIITIIQDVAHQTKMLSINSAIEASRLADKGGSFRVISSEIKKLSNEVNGEAINIQDRISKIEEQVKILANEAKKIYTLNNDSSKNLQITLSSYEDLKISTDNIKKVYLEIAHLFEKQEV